MEEDIQNPDMHGCVYQFDVEWPVDLANGIQGHVALISLVHNQSIYLLPVRISAYVYLC